MDSNLTAYSKQVYGPYHQEYCLLAEYNLLNFHSIPGMYVLPSAASSLKWYGVLFVRHGVYQGAVCRFTLLIPENYPDDNCPSVVLEQPIFHPLVDPVSGTVDVQRGFRKWRRNVNHLWQVLQYLRRIFVKVETEAPLNDAAARLFLANPEEFREAAQAEIRANQAAALCQLEEQRRQQQELEDEEAAVASSNSAPQDPHTISLEPLDDDLHAEALHLALTDPWLRCLEPPVEVPLFDEGLPQAATGAGFSWLDPDTMLILGREETEPAEDEDGACQTV